MPQIWKPNLRLLIFFSVVLLLVFDNFITERFLNSRMDKSFVEEKFAGMNVAIACSCPLCALPGAVTRCIRPHQKLG